MIFPFLVVLFAIVDNHEVVAERTAIHEAQALEIQYLGTIPVDTLYFYQESDSVSIVPR